MGNLFCMGLILKFGAIPTPRCLDNSDHRLPAGMDVDVFNRHLLLALAAVAVERFDQRGEGAGELIRLVQVFAPALEALGDPGVVVALHRRVVGRDQLRRHHTLQHVLRANSFQRS